MINTLYQCIGYRKPSPNDFDDEVILHEWYDAEYNPSGHLGLKIIKNGVTHYVSFSPVNAYGLTNIPFTQLRDGREGFILRDFDDQTLLWGFRRRWNAGILDQLSEAQTKLINELYLSNIGNNDTSTVHLNPSILDKAKSLGEKQLLAISKLFPESVQAKLKEYGQPNHDKVLFKTLDINAMLSRINTHNTAQPTWASWAGSYYHQPNTFNCASMMLDILYAGRMDRLLASRPTQYSAVGAMLGLLSLLITDDAKYICTAIAIGFAGGRILGGAASGYVDSQHFFNMIAGTKNDNKGTVFGLRLLSTFFGVILGALKTGPFLPAFLTLPKNVMALAQEAKATEDATYVPKRRTLALP